MKYSIQGHPMEERAIIHLNVADFAVAVERAMDARLRRRPAVIAHLGTSRATVYDMSEEAFQAGIRKGMALARARRLLREATILPPHPDRYEQAMGELLRRALPYTPLIEQSEGLGHLFLDVTGTSRLFGPPPDVAWRLRKAARAELGLDPIWSLAPSKLVAKVASRLVKPTGEYIVEAGEEEAFLRPLPLALLPGLEREDLRRLAELHLTRVHQVSALSRAQLEVVLGGSSRLLYEAVRGEDPSPVLSREQARPVLRLERTFAEDTNDLAQVGAALYALVEQAGAQLRRRRLACRRVGVLVDYSDGVRLVRQATAGQATAGDRALYALAQTALDRAWVRRVRLRHLRLVCDRLIHPLGQLELFAPEQRQERQQGSIDSALDRIRGRFGASAIQLGRTVEPRGGTGGSRSAA